MTNLIMATSVNNDRSAFWLGADPGGKNAFGVARLFGKRRSETFRVSCADEAVELIDDEPLGVGVDAPLWWSSGISGDREADRWIRKKYAIPAGTVQAANSLRGAALVQGMMFVQRIREKFPDVRVTEAHPKAVAIALGGWEKLSVSKILPSRTRSEHERDAIMSAIAAREGFCGNWPMDLSEDRLASEQDPRSFWLAPIHYYWPKT